MRESWGSKVLLAFALVCLGSGFAAGVIVGPRLRGQARPAVAAPAASEGASPVVAAARADGEGRARHAAAQAQLAVAATALSRVPNLRAEPGTEAPRGRPQLKVEDLPPEVQKVLHQVTLGQPVRWKTIERREREGHKYFKAEYDLAGMEQEYAIDEQGKILATESDVAVGELPAPVTSGIQNALPGAVLMEAERNQVIDSPTFYEIEIKYQGQQRELHVDEEGRIVRQRVR